MSRINIEDALFNDPRMEVLFRKLGREMAIGHFVFISKLAQRYHVEGEKIPKKIWNMGEYPKEFIDTGMVIEDEDGLYLSGSEEHFAWLVAKKENGKKGGRPRKNSDIEKATDNLTEPNQKLRESYENPPTPTPTPTPTQYNNTPAKKLQDGGAGKKSALVKDKAEDILLIWNSMATQAGLEKALALNKKRMRHIKKALEENPSMTRDDWICAVAQVPMTPWAMGESSSGWKAKFDWFIGPEKQGYLRMLEAYKSANEEGASEG